MVQKFSSILLTTLICLILMLAAVSPGEAGYTPVGTINLTTAAAPIMAAPNMAPSVVASPLPVTSIAAGFEHTCVLVSGAVKCWGSNRYGQLGSSLLTIHPFAINVSGLSGTIQAITAGANHTCALRASDGTVWCWGLNSLGQLGNNTTTNSAAPVQVSGLSGITSIAAGYSYTCAVTTAKTVACWGDNGQGQLGDGTNVNSLVPVAVSGLSNVDAISGSFDHTCALVAGGVMCWGKNVYGELGNGGFSASFVPVTVGGLGGVTVSAIAGGAQHTCALTSTGTVWCWGEGSLGQMGNATKTPKNPNPVQVSGLTGAKSLSAGGYADTGHTCAVTAANGAVCWGSNVLGQLGNGDNIDKSSPATVSGLSAGVQSVAVGVNHTCALLADSTVRCWGSDSSGQLGDGINSISTMAVDVNGLSSGVTLLGTGEQNTCALVNGAARCWGGNRGGQLSDGTFTNRPIQTAINGLSGTITALDSGANQTCAIVNGGVSCWGGSPTTIIPPTSVIPAGSGVTSLAVTNLHACAVVSGAAKCWGDNSKGQLGNGTNTPSATPVQVSGLNSGIKAVTAGQWFSCALLDAGQVQCWGDNTNGQLGNGSQTPSPTPVVVNGLSNASVVAAGQDHACALTTAGAALCWGNNQQGQLGDGTQTQRLSANPVSSLSSGVTAITAGGYHTCALVSGGVKCWGFNSFGQLGNGLTVLSKIPVNVTGLTSGVTAVVAGGVNYDEEHTCAVTTQGSLKCWGGNEYGQLGDNLPIVRNTPVKVLGLADGPEIGQNYLTGKPLSYFRMTAVNFPAGAVLTISANNRFMGTVTTTSEGYAIFHLLDSGKVSGAVSVTAAGATSVSTNLTIDAAAPAHLEEGSAPIYIIGALQVYMPTISR